MAKENEFYMQLINLALPPESNNHTEVTERTSRGTIFWVFAIYFWLVCPACRNSNTCELQIVKCFHQTSFALCCDLYHARLVIPTKGKILSWCFY